jgi:hypothetical protein
MVAGEWRAELDLGSGKRQFIGLWIDQKYQMLYAEAENALGRMKIEKPTLRGDEISFSLTFGANPYQFTGKVNDGKMDGTAVTPGNSELMRWRASKLPASK